MLKSEGEITGQTLRCMTSCAGPFLGVCRDAIQGRYREGGNLRGAGTLRDGDTFEIAARRKDVVSRESVIQNPFVIVLTVRGKFSAVAVG